MSKKDMHRSDWKRVIERKYISKDFLSDGIRGKVSLLKIEKVSETLTIDNVAGRVLIADSGISWLQIGLEKSHIWITVMYDPQDAFIQAYFDITDGNCFEDLNNPMFDDMYLDVVLNKKLEIYILDEDELEEAFNVRHITQQQYANAKQHCADLISYLQQNTDSFLHYCNNTYRELKQMIQ